MLAILFWVPVLAVALIVWLIRRDVRAWRRRQARRRARAMR